MTTTLIMIHELTLDEKELQAIEILEPMLAELQDYFSGFGKANTLQAVETGEIITVEEIARVRGVLDFLYSHRAVRTI